MKLMSRDFTLKEKIVLLVLALVLLGAFYYFCVDQPVRHAISNTVSEREELTTELAGLNQTVATLKRMQTELDTLEGNTVYGKMGSYNNSKAELDELNTILKAAQSYDISFNDVTREDNLIRRSFSLTFTVSDYDEAQEMVTKLCQGEWRCIVSDISFASPDSDLSQGSVSVGLDATFYETMVDGTADSGLPDDTDSEADTQESE